MLWIIEVEKVDSLEELKSSRSVCGKFSKFRDAGREDLEDRCPGEPARQERVARGDACELASKIYKLSSKRKTKLHSIRLPICGGLCRPHPQ